MLRFPNKLKGSWIRTCQECSFQQISKRPDSYKNESWRNLKCMKCHSEALDYGQENTELLEDDDFGS